jgi:hypothetical protein
MCFNVIDQNIIKKLREIDDEYPYTRGLIAGLSNKRVLVEYTWVKREFGYSKNSFSKLIDQILYKAKLNGLIVILTEESYTSKASFMNMDEIPIYGGENDENLYNFSGYRQHRGLYKIKGEKTTINADVNGSFNIIRKVVPNAFVDGIEGIPVCPIKVTFDK